MRTRAAGALVGCLLLAACSSSDPGGGSAATPAAGAAWRTVADRATGISFRLPQTPTVQSKAATVAGIPVDRRTYSVTSPDPLAKTGLGTAVTIETATDARATKSWPLDALPQQYIDQLSTDGASDAVVLEKRTLQVAGRPALSFRFRFTPPQGGPVVWLACAIDAGRALVIAETIGFPDGSHEQALLAEERPVQAKLVAGITV